MSVAFRQRSGRINFKGFAAFALIALDSLRPGLALNPLNTLRPLIAGLAFLAAFALIAFLAGVALFTTQSGFSLRSPKWNRRRPIAGCCGKFQIHISGIDVEKSEIFRFIVVI